jgi:hypothetical protein
MHTEYGIRYNSMYDTEPVTGTRQTVQGTGTGYEYWVEVLCTGKLSTINTVYRYQVG